MSTNGIADEAAAVGSAGGRYADLSALFCTEAPCPVIINDNLVFRDDNHITVRYARTLGPVLAMIAHEAASPRS